MNKKNLIQNYGLWLILVLVYGGFVLIKNNAWIGDHEELTPDQIISEWQTASDTGFANLSNQKQSVDSIQESEKKSHRDTIPTPAQPTSAASLKRTVYQPDPIDINSATKEEWETLRGIGDYRSDRILRFRDALGGFHSIDQVRETYDLPDSVFEHNRIYMHINTPHKNLKLNSIPYDSLHLHPYITKQMAYFIVRHRQNVAPIREMSQLYDIIDEKDHERLKKFEPYVDFSIR